MGLLYANPNNWNQTYLTMDATDPNIPAGYVLQTTECAIDYITTSPGDGRPNQRTDLGKYSGGYPAYGTPADDTSRPTWPS
jgi:hypothetical protein